MTLVFVLLRKKMSIIKAINKAIDKKEAGGWKKWPKLYWAIDLHDAIIKATYKMDGPINYFVNAKKVLRQLSKRKDMCLILWTGSYSSTIQQVMTNFSGNKIYFDYVNHNPECKSDELRDTMEKIYFDILIDDKAGFDPKDYDWEKVEYILKQRGLWYIRK